MSAERRCKIACIAYLHGSGGAERQIVALANEMAARGHDVRLFVLASYAQRYRIDKSVSVTDLTYAEKGHGPHLAKRYFALRRALSAFMPDVTVNFWYQSAYFCAFMSRKTTGSIVYSERGDPGDEEYRGLLGLVRSATLPAIDRFVFQTRQAKEYFGDEVQGRSVVIPNAIEVAQTANLQIGEDADRVVVSVGRLCAQKNQNLLIDAFCIFKKEHPGYKLVIFGDGELKEDLVKQVEYLGLTQNIFFEGAVADIWSRMKTARMFVLTSKYEGMPNALLEAMALGLPCVTTDYRPFGAVRDIVRDGENGFVVSDATAVQLAAKMSIIADNPSMAKALGSRARRSLEGFSKDKIYDEWEKIVLAAGAAEA